MLLEQYGRFKKAELEESPFRCLLNANIEIKPLRYYVYGTDKYNRLMNYYGQSCKDTEKATLSSMREVENAANMFYYTEE